MKEAMQIFGSIVAGGICFLVLAFSVKPSTPPVMPCVWQRVDEPCEVLTITTRLVIQDDQCTGYVIADYAISFANPEFVYASSNGVSISLFRQSRDTLINTRANPAIKYVKK